MINRDHSLLQHFDLDAQHLYWSDVHERFAARIREAVESRRLIGVIGRFGSGKSVLVREALNDSAYEVTGNRPLGEHRYALIYVNNPDKERLRIGHCMSAMIDHLSGENPRRDTIARSTQLSRIVGERVVRNRQDVVLVIENAHRLHANTLLALKDLREAAIYRGECPLFSAILVGQEALRAKLERYGEVHYRTKAIELSGREGWMTYKHRVDYLAGIYGPLIDSKMRRRLASLFESPLELDHFIEGKLEMMRDAGIQRMTSELVPISIREQRRALGVSLSELERLTTEMGSRVPSTSISDIELGKRSDAENQRRIQTALDRAAEARTRKAA